MPSLADIIPQGDRVDSHRPWPRVIVTADGWRHVTGAIAAGRADQKFELRQRLDDRARERRALAHRADNGKTLECLDDLVRGPEMLVEDLDRDIALHLRPVGHGERHVLVVVENCAANRHVSHPPGRRPLRRSENLQARAMHVLGRLRPQIRRRRLRCGQE